MHRAQRNPINSRTSDQSNATATRPTAKRLTSSGWGRLRAPQIDPLEAYGLPSKGESRLNDPKTQESYYRKIVDRYMRFCASSGSGDALEAAFSSMTITAPLDLRSASRAASRDPSRTSTPAPAVQQPTKPPPLSDSRYASPLPPSQPLATQSNAAPVAPTAAPSPLPTLTSPQKAELNLLLSAMRKLRESLTATGRSDTFAQRAYVFVLRSTLLMRQWEAYVPCLLHLLHRIHLVTPLGLSELREVVGWWVLDLACRQGKIREAMEVRGKWMGLRGQKAEGKGMIGQGKTGRDRNVDAALSALVRDDWIAWRRVMGRVDGYGRAVMGWAEEGVRVNLLKVVGRAYLRIEREVLEEWAGRDWEGLVREGVGWELEENGEGGTEWVVVRRIKGKAT
ncbi:hypothetical protein C1H76_1329 [Elsinoe australis]|uniref:Uncharacterized protein n=1 Tax=Elsinoe australis TaxID=40998 RepID=A0A4U7BEB7_9PEZI|nr:hypothetical protein C1H76_1329 [Elsinoe australis]